jgi:hypothetical protein
MQKELRKLSIKAVENEQEFLSAFHEMQLLTVD